MPDGTSVLTAQLKLPSPATSHPSRDKYTARNQSLVLPCSLSFFVFAYSIYYIRMSNEQAFDVDYGDSDYTPKSNADSDDDNSTVDIIMSDNEVVRLYKDQLINVHELLGCSDDDDDMSYDEEQQVDKKELVGLYKDQLRPIEELAPVSNVEALCSENKCSIVRRVPLKPYLIKFGMFDWTNCTYC